MRVRVNAGYIDAHGTLESVASAASAAIAPVSPGSHVRVVSRPIVGRIPIEDSAFSFTVPLCAFSEPDLADTLSYTASQLDGSPLPAWLAFNTGSRTFSGIPGPTSSGPLNVPLTATDCGGVSVRRPAR